MLKVNDEIEYRIPVPALYGIRDSNRAGDDLWGKNQFNSTFPASLCCYMRDQKISPVYISTDSNYDVSARDDQKTFDDVFNTTLPNSELKFLFEHNYAPFEPYLHDRLDHIDLVIAANGVHLRPLEVKLTVLPDNTTAQYEDPAEWGSELVIRPDSISYACLGVFHGLRDQRNNIRALLEPVAARIDNWENAAEILRHADEMHAALLTFFSSTTRISSHFFFSHCGERKARARSWMTMHSTFLSGATSPF